MVAALLIACGDSSDSNGDALDACAPVEPCGGDLVGTWRVESSCSTETEQRANDTIEEELPPECRGALDAAESDLSDLSYTFGADGVLSIAGATSVRLEYTFDADCLAALYPDLGAANAETCALLGPGMMGAMPANGENTASCVLEGSGCACEFGFAPDIATSGAYTTAGTQLTIEDQAIDYCVAGDRLQLSIPGLGTSIVRRQ